MIPRGQASRATLSTSKPKRARLRVLLAARRRPVGAEVYGRGAAGVRVICLQSHRRARAFGAFGVGVNVPRIHPRRRFQYLRKHLSKKHPPKASSARLSHRKKAISCVAKRRLKYMYSGTASSSHSEIESGEPVGGYTHNTVLLPYQQAVPQAQTFTPPTWPSCRQGPRPWRR